MVPDSALAVTQWGGNVVGRHLALGRWRQITKLFFVCYYKDTVSCLSQVQTDVLRAHLKRVGIPKLRVCQPLFKPPVCATSIWPCTPRHLGDPSDKRTRGSDADMKSTPSAVLWVTTSFFSEQSLLPLKCGRLVFKQSEISDPSELLTNAISFF